MLHTTCPPAHRSQGNLHLWPLADSITLLDTLPHLCICLLCSISVNGNTSHLALGPDALRSPAIFFFVSMGRPEISANRVVLSHFSHVQLFVTPWTIACQAPLSTGFSRQEYWSGLPFPSPEWISPLKQMMP